MARLPTHEQQDEHNQSGETSHGEGGGIPESLAGHVGMDSYSQRQQEQQARRDAQHEEQLEKLFE
eukprot:CAMPEP_0116842306 /NCGR_PEP_ID=MMETSP0418-20121206/11437_1 /TAXON_ID=1158023 /ORGANISM="Astrosyne radiata, Strain 13vi08-1A" /LENGTH=64 /DNA_ID=CAMNT_0004472889 /DNA_START=226 /DNA_END=420 /DNA_ORIENTATION=-